ncbi:MAG: hypothetical protein VX527_06805 [Planctomycetota bacterium]|nr:hypothetical protein [Planctomycetota bacterium]
MTIAFSGPASGDLLPWGARAWRDLEDAVRRLAPGPGQLLLRGHHKHILADGPACLRWLDHCSETSLSCGIALTPASMLAASMIDARDDHLTRLFEYLGPRCDAVILEDVTHLDDETIQGLAVGSGLLDGGLVGRLLEANVPGDIPVVVHAADLEQAERWLWPD